jgi:hypothetical protein
MSDPYRWPYSEVSPDWVPYDDTKDYCGPEGQWYSEVLTRDIDGIDCNEIYYAHDQRYRIGKTSKDKRFADKQMYKDQKKAIKASAAWWRPLRYRALIHGLRRYHMVKWFGQKAFDNAKA